MSPTVWAPIQRRLAGAIHHGAPRHTIVASGHAWRGIDQLEALQPLDDPNVIYAFHLYDPYVFTHRGAEWSPGPVGALNRVPHPSSPAALAPALARASDADVSTALERHQFGWTAWGYAGGFGVVDGPVGQRVIHAQTARALLGE